MKKTIAIVFAALPGGDLGCNKSKDRHRQPRRGAKTETPAETPAEGEKTAEETPAEGTGRGWRRGCPHPVFGSSGRSQLLYGTGDSPVWPMPNSAV